MAVVCSSFLKGEILEGVVLLKFVAPCNCSGKEEVGGPDNVADRGCEEDACSSAVFLCVGGFWGGLGEDAGGWFVSEMQG